MAIVASALSVAFALLLSAGSAPALNGARVVHVLGAIEMFFGVLLLLRVVIQMVREGE
jgi:hypothetical protein